MPPRIVALGDSVTAGHRIGAAAAFPAILQQKIDADGILEPRNARGRTEDR